MLRYSIYPAVLSGKAKASGEMPVAVAVSIEIEGKWKTKYRRTNYWILPKNWDAAQKKITGMPNANLYNANVKKQETILTDRISKLTLLGKEPSFEVLKDDFDSELKQVAHVVYKVVDFGEYAHSVRGVKATVLTDTELNKIRIFNKGTLPDIKTIATVGWLRAYLRHLQSVPYAYAKGTNKPRYYSHNTNVLAIHFLSRILIAAKKEKIIEYNPIGKDFERLEEDPPIPEFCEIHEIKKLHALLETVDKKSGTFRCLVWYLFGVYTGFRFSDWRKFDVEKHQGADKIRIKTKKTKEKVHIVIGPTLSKIITLLKEAGSCRTQTVFCRKMPQVAQMAGLPNKSLHPHSARHTFGFLCAINKMSEETTAELLGISLKHVKTYFHLTGEEIERQAAWMKDI